MEIIKKIDSASTKEYNNMYANPKHYRSLEEEIAMLNTVLFSDIILVKMQLCDFVIKDAKEWGITIGPHKGLANTSSYLFDVMEYYSRCLPDEKHLPYLNQVASTVENLEKNDFWEISRKETLYIGFSVSWFNAMRHLAEKHSCSFDYMVNLWLLRSYCMRTIMMKVNAQDKYSFEDELWLIKKDNDEFDIE